MSAIITTSIAVQQSATTSLVITGLGTNFTGSPISVSAGTITGQTVINAGVVSFNYAAPSGPRTVTFTDTGSGATCTVQVRKLPILELIRLNLLANLSLISQANGYFTSPAIQELRESNGDANQLIILGLGESQLIKPPEQKLYIKQTFYALCYVLPADGEVGSAAAVDPRLIYLYADVFKAIYTDRTIGSLAYDTLILPPSFESNAEEAQFRAAIPIQVYYQTLEADMTAQG